MSIWTIDKARSLYNLSNWSGGYFDVNEAGRVTVGTPGRGGVELESIVAQTPKLGVGVPVLMRFPHILRDRVTRLTEAFDRASQDAGFEGGYTPVYPIKVNQQRSVVSAILDAGNGRVGLEAGSKPELMVVLALAPREGIIVCNGYKDREYLRLALMGRMLGQRLYIVIEKPSELEAVIAQSRELGVRPLLGMRVRLASIGKGKWQNTGGEKAKFGVSAAQALRLLVRLREEGLLDCMRLLHFHMGSQIANVRDIQSGLREAARYYAELHRLGAPIDVVDVGGGLGVDYDGTRSRGPSSMNYTLQEYANNVVNSIVHACREHELPHPDIFSESGRALTAHHAVLVTNVIETESAPGNGGIAPPGEDDPLILHDLWRLYRNAEGLPPSEVWHDAVHWHHEAQSMYTHGVLSLEERATAERYYSAICRGLIASHAERLPRDVRDELHEKFADKYFCNFSVFQSIPDVWAIDQVFPILPLTRLNERPDRRGILQDLTCDSDGHVDIYVQEEGIKSTLALHALRPNEPYLIGIFLVGAYQEILGDLHNLFGDTDSINVEIGPNGKFTLVEPEIGDTVGELLRYVHYDPAGLSARYREKIAAAGIDGALHERILAELDAGLDGYTYLEE